jgi:hypothetical protein
MAREMLIRLRCDYCKTAVEVSAEQPTPEDQRKVKDWVQCAVLGNVLTYCCARHAQQGMKLLAEQQSDITLTDPSGGVDAAAYVRG